MNLADLPVDALAELLDAAREADDAGLILLYSDALAAHAAEWIPQDYQRAPAGNWALWLFLAGRFSGKTDTGAHAVNEHALSPPCDPRVPGGHRMRLIGPTFTDTVASCVNGPTGLKAHNPEIEMLTTKEGTIVRWPNEAVARIFGAYTPEDPERLRAGGNSCFDWYEEMATWRQLDATLEQAEMGLRLGDHSQAIATTTPKNRAKIRELRQYGQAFAAATVEEQASLERFQRVHLTSASTADNRHGDPEVRASLYSKYAGTRLGAQELEAQVLESLGTFFVQSWFRWLDAPTLWPRKVRSWDLAGTSPGPANEDPDWTVGALISYDPQLQPHVLADGTIIMAGSFAIEHIERLRDTPALVEQAVVDTARRDGPAVRVIIEKEPGQSGKSQVSHYQQALAGIALVEEFSPSGPKNVRAQLVSGPAQQGRVSIVRGPWVQALLDELEEYTGDEKVDHHDDQVDALSQGFAQLEGRGGMASATAPTGSLPSRDAVLAGGRGMSTGIPRGR